MARGNTNTSTGTGTTSNTYQPLHHNPNNQNVDPSQNPLSPYYIHSSENPSNTMVSSL